MNALQSHPVPRSAAAVDATAIDLSASGMSPALPARAEEEPDTDTPPVETPTEPGTDEPPLEPAPTPHEHPAEVPCEPGPCRW